MMILCRLSSLLVLLHALSSGQVRYVRKYAAYHCTDIDFQVPHSCVEDLVREKMYGSMVHIFIYTTGFHSVVFTWHSIYMCRQPQFATAPQHVGSRIRIIDSHEADMTVPWMTVCAVCLAISKVYWCLLPFKRNILEVRDLGPVSI